LTIAGSDPSGGAGIQADLKTFHQHHVFGAAAITLLTVQNTLRVSRVEVLPPDLTTAQIAAVTEDLPVQAAKTGALGNAAMIAAVAEAARDFRFPLVVDPVMVSKHGAALLPPEAVRTLVQDLLPRATVLMPNLPEAAVILGCGHIDRAGMEAAAKQLLALGPQAVLLKGGHLEGESSDLLMTAQGAAWFPSEHIDTPHTHGTGCTYSAAVTALLARGLPLLEVVSRAKAWLHEAIKTNPGLGGGSGPVNHFAAVLD
jgi:hydroxymethylpyrimidine/phosphomethylpyrimidine kinase